MTAAFGESPGYVLHARPWRETSLLLECLMPAQGRVGLIARGVRAARSPTARADLQPLRLLRMRYSAHGELGRLHAAEVVALHVLQGRALLSALYVNELLVRLLPREDPQPRMFQRYDALLQALASGAGGWTLRCFERDLLAAIGYAPQLEHDCETGEPIRPQQRYVYRSEQGARRRTPHDAVPGIRGAALLALARGEAPDAADQRDLRRLLRALISEHLAGRPLAAWTMAPPAGRPPPAAG